MRIIGTSITTSPSRAGITDTCPVTGAPDGDNVPRASYHGFKLASEAFGAALDCKVKTAETDAESDVTCYFTERPNGTKAVMLVNKHPEPKRPLPWPYRDGKVRGR